MRKTLIPAIAFYVAPLWVFAQSLVLVNTDIDEDCLKTRLTISVYGLQLAAGDTLRITNGSHSVNIIKELSPQDISIKDEDTEIVWDGLLPLDKFWISVSKMNRSSKENPPSQFVETIGLIEKLLPRSEDPKIKRSRNEWRGGAEVKKSKTPVESASILNTSASLELKIDTSIKKILVILADNNSRIVDQYYGDPPATERWVPKRVPTKDDFFKAVGLDEKGQCHPVIIKNAEQFLKEKP